MKSVFAGAMSLVLFTLASTLHAQVPNLINYQGRVAVGTVNFDGTGSFKFALVDGAGTVTYWSNDGTSAACSEPSAAVTLTVAKGLYSVLLGDTTLPNMTAMPATIFANADVHLRVWFDDGVNGSQLLAPDARIAAVGYAMVAADVADGAITSAKIAPEAVNVTHLAPGSITGDRLAAATIDATHLLSLAPPGAGEMLTFDGANLLWAPAGGGGGDSVFSLNGTSAYYNAGNVGIGTSTPLHKLGIAGGPLWTSNSWTGNIELSNASAIGWRVNAGGWSFGIGHTNGGLAFFRTASNPGNTASPALYDMYINDAGAVAIGTLSPNPGYLLAVNGGVQFTPGGLGGTMQFGTPNSETGMTWTTATKRADLRFDGTTVKLLAGPAGGPPGNTSGIAVTTGGAVGIGTTSPVAKLDVVANGDAIYGQSTSGIGVYGGGGGTYPGVYGNATGSGEGVHGQSSGSSAGVNGTCSGNGPGVYGISTSGYAGYFAGTVFTAGRITANSGMTATAPSGFPAGSFLGNVSISGNLTVSGSVTKSSGTFQIDHPLDPANKFLYHSFVESPDMKNIYDGNITTDAAGEATVTLPDYFEALNRDFRYQLTAIGQFAQAIVGSEISERHFTIKTDKPHVKVSWQVTGVRQDAFAEAHRVVVEVAKEGAERGTYLHPELFSQPAVAYSK